MGLEIIKLSEINQSQEETGRRKTKQNKNKVVKGKGD
jgi:hypothetical protein